LITDSNPIQKGLVTRTLGGTPESLPPSLQGYPLSRQGFFPGGTFDHSGFRHATIAGNRRRWFFVQFVHFRIEVVTINSEIPTGFVWINDPNGRQRKQTNLIDSRHVRLPFRLTTRHNLYRKAVYFRRPTC